MKPLVLLLFALAGLAQAQAPSGSVYTLDPRHTFVHIEFLHFGVSTSRARFGPVTGEVTLDRARGSGEVGVRIPTASVDTGLAVFDARLRKADLLASDEYPEAYFVSRNFRFEGGALVELRGEFTWRGKSQPLALRTLRFGCHAEEGSEVCGGDFEGEVLRSDFGATFGLPFVADRVRLLVQVLGRTRPAGQNGGNTR